jgi:hypothetical protein
MLAKVLVLESAKVLELGLVTVLVLIQRVSVVELAADLVRRYTTKR